MLLYIVLILILILKGKKNSLFYPTTITLSILSFLKNNDGKGLVTVHSLQQLLPSIVFRGGRAPECSPEGGLMLVPAEGQLRSSHLPLHP